MKPEFPYAPVIGRRVFFRCTARDYVSYYGKIDGLQKGRIRVKLLNVSGHMTFDAATGIARPNFREHQLCWTGGEEYKGLDYNAAMSKAAEDMKAAENGNT